MALYFLALMFTNAGIQIMSGLLVLLFLVHLFKQNNQADGKALMLFLKGPLVLAALFTASGFFSLLLNLEDWQDVFRAMSKYRWLLYYVSFTYLIYFFYKPRWVKKSHGFYFIIILMTLLALHQAYTGVDIIAGKDYRLVASGDLFRSVGTFSIPLTFAYVYGMLFFGLLPQLFLLKSKFSYKRLGFLSLVGLALLVGLIYSQTRGAWLAFVCTLFLFFLVHKPLRNYSLILCILLGGFYFLSPDHIQYRVNSMVNVSTDESNLGRFAIWKGHYHLFQQKKSFGWGMGNNVNHLQESYDQLGIVGAQINHAHNNYIHILSAQGLVGFVLYLFLNVTFLFMSWRLYKASNPVVSCLGLSVFLIQVFFALGGLTEATFLDQELNHQLVFCWALVSALSAKESFGHLGKATPLST